MEVGRPRRTGPLIAHKSRKLAVFIGIVRIRLNVLPRLNRSQSAMNVSSSAHSLRGLPFSFGSPTKVGPAACEKAKRPRTRGAGVASRVDVHTALESGLVHSDCSPRNSGMVRQRHKIKGGWSNRLTSDLECFTLCKSIRLVGRDAGSLSARIKGQMGVNMKVPKDFGDLVKSGHWAKEGVSAKSRHDCFQGLVSWNGRIQCAMTRHECHRPNYRRWYSLRQNRLSRLH